MSMTKSNAYAGRSANVTLIQSVTGFEVKSLPFYYLGAPIYKGRKRNNLFAPLVEKLRNKLTRWNLEHISQGAQMGSYQECLKFYVSIPALGMLSSSCCAQEIRLCDRKILLGVYYCIPSLLLAEVVCISSNFCCSSSPS